MSEQKLEERVRRLEEEVAKLKSRLPDAPSGNWRGTVGMFRGDGAFREIVEAGQAIRKADWSDE